MVTWFARLGPAMRGIGRTCCGNAAIEFAFAAPILIGLAFGAFDYGRAYVESVRLTGAAREGAPKALYDPSSWQDDALIEQAALEEYAGHALTPDEMSALSVAATSQAFCACQNGADLDCSETCPDGSLPGQFVRVRLTRSVPLTLPYPWASGDATAAAGEAVVRVR
jgi:Flp pilus assembly protein TadG